MDQNRKSEQAFFWPGYIIPLSAFGETKPRVENTPWQGPDLAAMGKAFEKAFVTPEEEQDGDDSSPEN